MKRTLRDAVAAVNGQLVGDDRPFGAVATDSRTLAPGSLFAALRGPNFDGRDYVAAAAARGAVGAIVERAVPDAISQIVVPNALRALQQLGRAWRKQLRHSGGRGRRQQRQDHGQGDDLGDSVAHGSVHGDPRQS